MSVPLVSLLVTVTAAIIAAVMVILQSEVPVLADDTENSLAQRVLKDEHIIYPMVVDWYAQGRLRLVNDSVEFDGQLLEKALLLQEIINVQHPATV